MVDLRKSYATISQAAEALGVTRQTVRTWLAKGKLTAEKVGREKLITIEQIESQLGTDPSRLLWKSVQYDIERVVGQKIIRTEYLGRDKESELLLGPMATPEIVEHLRANAVVQGIKWEDVDWEIYKMTTQDGAEIQVLLRLSEIPSPELSPLLVGRPHEAAWKPLASRLDILIFNLDVARQLLAEQMRRALERLKRENQELEKTKEYNS